MTARFLLVSVAMILILVLAGGCVALPESTTSATSTSGASVTQVETPGAAATAADSLPTQQATETPPPAAEVTPTAALEATSAPTAAPTATSAVETAPAAGVTTTAGSYRGPSPYGSTPLFEVTYDPALWEYAEDDGSGRPGQLKHRSLTGCALWLRAGPVGATPVASVYRADREWTIAQVNENTIQYVSPQDRIAWIFGLILPEPYTGMANSTCQDAAEQVIDTFQVVAEPGGGS